ncbi:dynein axonemal assembly factor 3-like [Hypomesus transpacificus]|uniref:dynein axonemal assembly factor 3-like n=1 Tax=Hypomesus transpacificus TaxID=137520 RepID=UPI001F073007|nr:dynein axonemal assembly factor 3-like [Hypomesus transpacificus]XP_046906754.1 dynein axonemal assembly factor 3-like [Hypomesus transpacificus]XP_046906755.1 dynein axonemal assembly factor 3-like [Hypomesus transpacificus]
MNRVRALEGAGCVTWWGFSPAQDLLSSGPVRQEGEVRMLLIGSADPRHIMKTVAGLKDTDSLHVWVLESSIGVVARQLLLLAVCLAPPESMGLHEKTEVFLELFGNSEVRSQTDDTLRHLAAQLSFSVSNRQEDPHPCLNTSHLKFKEIDELLWIFKQWTKPTSPSPRDPCDPRDTSPMSRVWEGRVRQHLGVRYDSRRGCFDWDLTMKLHQKGCGVINNHHYTRWRERGVAFEMREGVYQTTNQSLLSTRVFSKGGEKVPAWGYWGDIVSSPYLSFGIESDDDKLLQKQNGNHVKTAQDVSYANVQSLLQSLAIRGRSPLAPQSRPDSTVTSETSYQTETTHRSDVYEPLQLDRVSVSFLPLDSLSKLPDKHSYAQLFNTIYCSASMVHNLGPELKKIAAPKSVLVVELTKFLLDLTKEQEEGFAESVAAIGVQAGFVPAQGEESDVFATFARQEE